MNLVVFCSVLKSVFIGQGFPLYSLRVSSNQTQLFIQFMAGVCPATVVFKEIFAKMLNYINNRLTVLTDEVTQD